MLKIKNIFKLSVILLVVILYFFSTLLLIYTNKIILDDYATFHSFYRLSSYAYIVFIVVYLSDIFSLGNILLRKPTGFVYVLKTSKVILLVTLIILVLNIYSIYYLLTHYFVEGVYSLLYVLILAFDEYAAIFIYPYYSLLALHKYCAEYGNCFLPVSVRNYIWFFIIFIISMEIPAIYNIPPIKQLIDTPLYTPSNMVLTPRTIEILNNISLKTSRLIGWYTRITLFIIFSLWLAKKLSRKNK